MATDSAVMPMQERCPVDMLTLVCVCVLLAVGVLLVASASSEISAREYGNTLYLVARHIVFVRLSVLLGFSILMIPLDLWQRSGWLDAAFKAGPGNTLRPRTWWGGAGNTGRRF